MKSPTQDKRGHDADDSEKKPFSAGPKGKHNGQVGKTPQPTYKGGKSYC